MTGLFSDFRYALRQIRKAPGSVATTIVVFGQLYGSEYGWSVSDWFWDKFHWKLL